MIRALGQPVVIENRAGAGSSIAAAKKAPDSLNYASSGVGSAPHFGAAAFSQITGIRMVHVPFKGGAPAVVSVVAGDTQLSFATPPSVLPMVKAGRLKALAVTNTERSPLMPEVPGMIEAGVPEFSIAFGYGLFLPAGTPPEIVKKIFDAAQSAAQRPEFKVTLAREGTEVALSKSTAEFAAFLVEDAKFWVKLAKDSGATAD